MRSGTGMKCLIRLCLGKARGGLQLDTQPGEATSAGGPDAADGQAELVGYLGIGNGRISHQQLEQPLPSTWKARHGIVNDLSAFVSEKTRVDIGFMGHSALEIGVIVTEHYSLTCRYATQALIPRGGREPGAHAIGILDAVDVLEQSQPGRLGDVSGIALPQPEFPGNGPDEPGELINQAFPRLSVPASGASYQPRDTRGTKILLPRSYHRLLLIKRHANRPLTSS